MPHTPLSTAPILGEYLGVNTLPNTPVVNYTYGPIAFQVPSSGLAYQIWRIRVMNNRISITSPNTPEYEIFSFRDIKGACLTFDQNARQVISYLLGTDLWLFWFDPVLQGYTHTLLETGVSSMYITLDDNRKVNLPYSDIILGYTKDSKLFVRQQSDRYTTPHLLIDGVAGRLSKIGMSNKWRIQYLFEQNPFPVYEDPWPFGSI